MLVMELIYAVGFLALVLVLSVIASVVYYQVDDSPDDLNVNCKKCNKKMVYHNYRWMCPYCGRVIK